MAELQLSVVSESESRRQIGAQIAAWEENLERLHCEQFRLRCYMASLQHGELPNPKVRTPWPAYFSSGKLAGRGAPPPRRRSAAIDNFCAGRSGAAHYQLGIMEPEQGIVAPFVYRATTRRNEGRCDRFCAQVTRPGYTA